MLKALAHTFYLLFVWLSVFKGNFFSYEVIDDVVVNVSIYFICFCFSF